jgi:hypothetical protein
MHINKLVFSLYRPRLKYMTNKNGDVIMRTQTALLFLLAIAGCSSTPTPVTSPVAVAPTPQTPTPVVKKPVPIVLSHEGIAGHPFQAGDTLTWTTLDEPTSKSYRLTFPKNNPACNLPPTAVVTVTPNQPFSCQGMAPAIGHAVYYKITAIPHPTGPINNPSPGPSPQGVTVDAAIPCRLCD